VVAHPISPATKINEPARVNIRIIPVPLLPAIGNERANGEVRGLSGPTRIEQVELSRLCNAGLNGLGGTASRSCGT